MGESLLFVVTGYARGEMLERLDDDDTLGETLLLLSVKAGEGLGEEEMEMRWLSRNRRFHTGSFLGVCRDGVSGMV